MHKPLRVILLGGQRRGARKAAQDEDAGVGGDDGCEARELGGVGRCRHATILASAKEKSGDTLARTAAKGITGYQ